jgi:hypothetical protein
VGITVSGVDVGSGVLLGGIGVRVVVGGAGVGVRLGVRVGRGVQVGYGVSVGHGVREGVIVGGRTGVAVINASAGYSSNMAENQSSPSVWANSLKRAPA